ncbi:hypothetical protein ONZ51_g3270 [Trametes cubensis]|uniref:EthD domain-containing protein n=1 Tax=Trametes cubensis TaxID=1111947 RepID=A0AAD7U0H7_9APHY|nr:hypothetical protein ONZ51_g3270 [Trametes cubensis]
MVSFAPKEGMSAEDFRAHWLGTHAPLFLSVQIVRANLLKYEQFYADAVPTATTAQIAATIGQESNSVLPTGGGVALLEAETPEKILEIFKDEEFLRVAAPDQANFINHDTVRVLFGHYVTIVEA